MYSLSILSLISISIDIHGFTCRLTVGCVDWLFLHSQVQAVLGGQAENYSGRCVVTGLRFSPSQAPPQQPAVEPPVISRQPVQRPDAIRFDYDEIVRLPVPFVSLTGLTFAR